MFKLADCFSMHICTISKIFFWQNSFTKFNYWLKLKISCIFVPASRTVPILQESTYCHYCHYCHYCPCCHYCHYCLLGMYKGVFWLTFGTRKVTFSQTWRTDRPTDGPTDQRTDRPTVRRTTRLLELLRAATNTRLLDFSSEVWI